MFFLRTSKWGAEFFYAYDGEGNIVRSIDFIAQKEYTYTYEEGKILRATEADITVEDEVITSKVIVNTVRYYYDAEGEMTRKAITFSDATTHTVFYETADDKTVVKFTAGGNDVTSHSKTDSFGRKIFDELQFGTGFVSREFDYHKGEVTEEHLENGKLKSSPTTQLVSKITLSDGRTISYEYDAEERITKVTDSVDGETVYTYDALGQLLTERRNGHMINSMTYDTYGNILSKNGKLYTYDTVWRDLLLSVDGEEVTYDAQGNPTTYLGHTLTWEKGRQLKSFDNNTYTYNANGIRTSKTINGVTHTYTLDGTKILREVWADNTLIPLYDNEDNVCGILYNNVPYYFIKNLQGDVIAIVDKDAQTVARYSYDAWGVCTILSDSTGVIANINPFRYRGYYYDAEIAKYYLQSRYYDAVVGRFVNGDDTLYNTVPNHILVQNLYAYALNSPANYIDSLGKALNIGDVIVGIFTGIVSEYIATVMAQLINCFLNGKKISAKTLHPSTGTILGSIFTYIFAGVAGALDFLWNGKMKFEIALAIGTALIDEVASFLNSGQFKFSSFIRRMLQNIISWFIFKALKKKLTPKKGREFNKKVREQYNVKGQNAYDRIWENLCNTVNKRVGHAKNMFDIVRKGMDSVLKMIETFFIDCLNAAIQKSRV